MPSQINYVLEQGKQPTGVEALYVKSVQTNTAGIPALASHGVNPFHVSRFDGENRDKFAVYCICDANTDTTTYFFEEQYQEAFSLYRQRIDDSNKSKVRLFVAVLTPQGDAQQTFTYHDPFENRELGAPLEWIDHDKYWAFC